MSSIMVLGEALIDAFADTGVPLRKAKTLHPRPGGAPANVAYALAGLGADVGFIGRVGADEYGEWLISLLNEKGVDTTHFVADPSAPTMLAIVAAPTPTDQHFILYAGASALLQPESLPVEAISEADIFVFGGVTLASGSRDAALEAASDAKSAGNIVIFDVNLRPSLWSSLEDARAWSYEAISLTDVVKLNETELEFLTGRLELSSGSQHLIDEGVKLCCVTLGAKGAYFSNGAVCGHVPAIDVDVVDTTGSGDAFVAGLSQQISQLDIPISLASERQLARIVRFANACGSLAACQPGAMCDLPRVEDILSQLT